LLYVALGPEWF